MVEEFNKKSNGYLYAYSPCSEESDLSINCLAKNGYDATKCGIYFENYRMCKKFWGRIERARRRAGIEPNLPSEEERAKIYELYKAGKYVFKTD